MPRIYTIGYQPIDIVGRSYELADLMNIVMELGITSGSVTSAVIQYLKKFKLDAGDKFLLSVPTNRDFIPYIWSELGTSSDGSQNLLVYDPPYAGSPSEVYKLLKDIHSYIGGESKDRSYIDAINSARTTLSRNKDNMSPKDYYTALLLLSDVNGGKVEPFINHLMQFQQPWQMEMKKKVIYLGDPVTPEFMQYLTSMGIFVAAYVPYESFTVPCDSLDQYYYDNPLYQSKLFMLIELRRLISLYFPDAIIMNPGGIYLTEADADFFEYKLAVDTKIIRMPGTYAGIQVNV